MVEAMAAEFPFLESYGSLLSHLESLFADLDPSEKADEKGERFTEFAIKLIPQLELGQRFERPKRNKKRTHDKGIDFTSDSLDKTEILYGQAKYLLARVEDLDSVLSKFQAFDSELRGILPNKPYNLPLLPELEERGKPTARYIIVTISDLKIIKRRYEQSQMASRDFYDKLKKSGRIDIIDGPMIFQAVRDAYRKQFTLPSRLTIQLAKPFIHMDPVYVGVIAGTELKRIYDEFGNALFLENIRESLGLSGRVSTSEGRMPVNTEIQNTLLSRPDKFLSRNNGITFRAESVSILGDHTLQLDAASIVNGCQTTMTVVRTVHTGSFILVKIVQGSDTWDIAEAANFQNEIKLLDLRLAQNIRPQQLRLAASKFNTRFKSGSDEASAFVILDAFYDREISYEEMRTLFIGFFSNTPNNVLQANYTNLKNELIGQILDNSESKERVFEILFKIHTVVQDAAATIQRTEQSNDNTDMFRRFWREDKPSYRMFLAILAACGCARQNIYAEGSVTPDEMMGFLQRIARVIDIKPEIFTRYYHHGFVALTFGVGKFEDEPERIVQHMHRDVEGSDFRNLYKGLLRLAQNDDVLQAMEASIGKENAEE